MALGRCSLVFALLVLVSACSAPRLAYERLDWLANWKLRQFVSLDAAQQRQYEAAFEDLWRWHRAQELPRLHADLQLLIEDARTPLGAEQIEAWRGRAEQYAQAVLQRALPPACELMRSLNEEQRASILRRLDRNLAGDTKKYLSPSLSERQQRSAKRTGRNLERWVGELSPEQLQRVQAWSATRVQRYEYWIAERRQRRERLAQVLAQRDSAQACEALPALFPSLDPKNVEDPQRKANAQAWNLFLSDFSSSLSATQRQYLRQQLLALAEDLRELSQESAAPEPTPS